MHLKRQLMRCIGATG